MSILTKSQVDAGLAALDRIKKGKEPTQQQLDDAPVLDLWTAHANDDGAVILGGQVSGHPSINDGPCTTSPVIYMPTDRAWARTVSRYYRLGHSLSDVIAQSRATH